MPDDFGGTPFEKQVREELLRIGLGSGLNVGGAMPAQLLEALRMTPDRAGAQALFANLAIVVGRGPGQ